MANIISNPIERKRFIKFAMVGAIGALVDFMVFNFLISFIRITPVLASIVSFLMAVLSNFLWNRYWTYPDSRSKPIHYQMIQFAIISIIGLFIRTPLFVVLERPIAYYFYSLNLVDYLFFNAEWFGHNIALAIAIIVVMFWNYFINRYLTYSDVI